MLTRILLVAAAVVLAACERPAPDSPPERATWALVDKSKVQAELRDAIKEANPYPVELADEPEEDPAMQQLRAQAARLQEEAISRCLKMERGESPYSRSGRDAMLRGLAATGTDEAQRCLNQVKEDPLIVNLQMKEKARRERLEKRRQHDMKVQKIVDRAVDEAIEAFAVENGFELVITNEASIAYNQSRQVVQITDGVVSQLQAEAAAAEP